MRRLFLLWLAALTLCVSSPDLAVAIDRGRAVIVDGARSDTPLRSGGSRTLFSLQLPDGAECPGDSADAGYRVQSFLIPEADDPADLRYFSVSPVGDGRFSLFDTFTNPYSQAQTAQATRKGGPGAIIDVPEFTWTVFVPAGILKAGRYHIGIACSLRNETVRYWSTDIQIIADATDEPAGFRWRALDPAPPTRVNRAVRIALIEVAAVAVFFGVRRLVRRRTGRRPTQPQAVPS